MADVKSLSMIETKPSYHGVAKDIVPPRAGMTALDPLKRIGGIDVKPTAPVPTTQPVVAKAPTPASGSAVRDLLDEITRVLPDGGPWCTIEKAETLACLVVALRPKIVVEIGVWSGGSLVPMLLAMKRNKIGVGVAIDPWSPAASATGQNATNATWWGGVDHEAAYRTFQQRLASLGLAEICTVRRAKSDDVEPPVADLLHIDGNHGEQALRDVERFAPWVSIGGILVLDDVDWEEGHVRKAYARARELGFEELYKLGTGCVLIRRTSVM